jgi:membrane-bound lytic murein transglycosylase D
MLDGLRRRGALVAALFLVTTHVGAQTTRPPSRVDRSIEQARRILEAARSAGLVELPEPGERAFRDVLAALDIDEVAPIDDAMRSWDEPVGHGLRSAPPVDQFVRYFTQGAGRSTFETGYRRSGLYRSLAEQIFREEGVPVDMIWLAQVESLWKPWAVSSASAKGLWQFIPATGARFGLDRTYWIDERANPEKATRAAARYLAFLHRRFKGDWMLALAAYNAGEGAVGRAVNRAGRADFWHLYRRGYLPRETRNYVPAILATIRIAKSPRRYGIRATPSTPWRYDTVTVREQIAMQDVAEICGASLADAWQHNPDLRRGVTPPGRYTLRIPPGARARFRAARN